MALRFGHDPQVPWAYVAADGAGCRIDAILAPSRWLKGPGPRALSTPGTRSRPG